MKRKEINIVEWLKDHPLISLNALEKECGLPQSALSKAINGHQKLSEKHHETLYVALQKYGL